MKENKCFICHKPGHQARFCRERQLAIKAVLEDKDNGMRKQDNRDRVACIRQLMGNLSVNEFGQLMEQLAEEHQGPIESEENQHFQ